MNLKYPTPGERTELDEFAFQIRAVSLEFITTAGWGHIGGSFSEAELLACLYGGAMNLSPAIVSDSLRDRFVLSKAHASPGLYAALALKGFFPFERLYKYCRLHGLDGHTQRNNPPGMEYSGGSLGTGLSYAAGAASALRLNDQLSPCIGPAVADRRNRHRSPHGRSRRVSLSHNSARDRKELHVEAAAARNEWLNGQLRLPV
jgi:transketolase